MGYTGCVLLDLHAVISVMMYRVLDICYNRLTLTFFQERLELDKINNPLETNS